MFPRLLLVLALLWLPLLPAAAQSVDPGQLTSRYQQWRQAMIEGDLDGWRAATSTRRQVELANEIISRGGAFPEALFDDELDPPATGNLSRLGVRSSDAVCHLFYFGRVDFGVGEADGGIPAGLLMLRFLQEDGRWLFDSLSYYNFADQPEVRAQLAAGNQEPLLGPDFAPPQEAPEVPERVAPPALIAQLYIRSPLHRVQARINGVSHTYESAGEVAVSTVIGGLRRGENTIRFGVAELPGVPHPYPGLSVTEGARHNAPLELSIWLVPGPGSARAAPELAWRWTASTPDDLPDGPQEVTFEVD